MEKIAPLNKHFFEKNDKSCFQNFSFIFNVKHFLCGLI
jgi:hypothetical protein